jgi:hypothetical protein
VGSNSRSFIPLEVKRAEGNRVAELAAQGMGYREIAQVTGLSVTTAWRRHWFVRDLAEPGPDGKRVRRIPRQRGTRERPAMHPRRRPYGTPRPAPREPGWASVYTSWCSQCRERYTRGRSACPRCGQPARPS